MHDPIYRPASLDDLDGIYDHIELDHPQRAFEFVENIRQHRQRLRAHPMPGRARDDLGPGMRIFPMQRRVVIAYRIDDSTIVIIRIFYGGRDYEALLRDDEDDQA